MYRTVKHRPELEERLKSTNRGALTLNLMERYNDLSELPNKAWIDTKLNMYAVEEDSYNTCIDYYNNLVSNVSDGKGLYIYGGTGNGKTTWAYKIARGYIEIVAQSARNNELPVYYANVPTLMGQLKMAFKDDKLQDKITRNMYEADLVVFDDIGAEKSSDWSQEQLYQFINYRYSNGLAMIFTSNVPVDNLEVRIADRIKEINSVVNFKGRSRR